MLPKALSVRPDRDSFSSVVAPLELCTTSLYLWVTQADWAPNAVLVSCADAGASPVVALAVAVLLSGLPALSVALAVTMSFTVEFSACWTWNVHVVESFGLASVA